MYKTRKQLDDLIMRQSTSCGNESGALFTQQTYFSLLDPSLQIHIKI